MHKCPRCEELIRECTYLREQWGRTLDLLDQMQKEQDLMREQLKYQEEAAWRYRECCK